MEEIRNDVVEVVEPVEGEVVNTEETFDENGNKVTFKDAAVGATLGVVLCIGVIETTKKVIRAGKWCSEKIKSGIGKMKEKKRKKEAEVTNDVAEVISEPDKTE